MLKDLIKKLYEWSLTTENSKNKLLKRIKKLSEEESKRLTTVLDHVESLNWKTVMMDSEEFQFLVQNAGINPVAKINLDGPQQKNSNPVSFNKSTPVKVKNLPSREMYDAMIEMGADDEDEVEIEYIDEPYDDDNLLFSPPVNNSFSSNRPNSRGGLALTSPVPMSGVGFGAESIGKADLIDSVYNFAIVYIYGSKSNNLVTLFSVNEEKKLFIHDQQKFTIKTASDVIEVCEQLNAKYDLDHIFFVDTDSAKSVKAYVERGISDTSIKVELLKEMVSFNNSVDELPMYMGSGDVLLLSNPWMREFQIEISEYFGSKNGYMPKLPGKTYPRLKSVTYGINLWKNNKETELFVRDYGINEENN